MYCKHFLIMTKECDCNNMGVGVRPSFMAAERSCFDKLRTQRSQSSPFVRQGGRWPSLHNRWHMIRISSREPETLQDYIESSHRYRKQPYHCLQWIESYAQEVWASLKSQHLSYYPSHRIGIQTGRNNWTKNLANVVWLHQAFRAWPRRAGHQNRRNLKNQSCAPEHNLISMGDPMRFQPRPLSQSPRLRGQWSSFQCECGFPAT